MENYRIVYNRNFGFGVILDDSLALNSVLFLDGYDKKSVSKGQLIDINYNFVEYCVNDYFSHRFSYSTIRKGEEYYEEQRVINISATKDEIIAKVKGNELYTTKINMSSPFAGSCSCPVTSRCKHLFALFSELRKIFVILKRRKDTAIASDKLPPIIVDDLEKLMYAKVIDEDYYKTVYDLQKCDDEVVIEFFKQITKVKDKIYSNALDEVVKYALMDDRIRECLDKNFEVIEGDRFPKFLRIYLDEANNFAKDKEGVELRFEYFYYFMRNDYQKAFPVLLSKLCEDESKLTSVDKELMKKIEINEDSLNDYCLYLDGEPNLLDKTSVFYNRLSDEEKKKVLAADGVTYDYNYLSFIPDDEKINYYHHLNFEKDKNISTVLDNIVVTEDNYLTVATVLEKIAVFNSRRIVASKLEAIATKLPKNKYLLYFLQNSFLSNASYYTYEYIDFELNRVTNEDEEAFYLYFKDSIGTNFDFDEDDSDYKEIHFGLFTLDGHEILHVYRDEDGNYYQTKNVMDNEYLCHYTKYFTSSVQERNKDKVNNYLTIFAKRRAEEEFKRRREIMVELMKNISNSYKGKKINLAKNSKAHLEYHFSSFDRSEMALELKVGIDKTYVVRDIFDFAQKFRNNETTSYGKNLILTHNIDNFIDEDKEALLNILMNVESSRYGYSRRNFVLNAYLVDKLFSLLKGRKVFIGDVEYLLSMNEVKLENKVDSDYNLHLQAPTDNYFLIDTGNKLLVVDDKKHTIDYANADQEEKNLYRFFKENDGMNIEEFKKEFNDFVFSNYPGSIEIAEEIKKDFKLADLQIKAYFDYKDKCIEVNTHYYLDDKEITRDKIKKQRDLLKLENYEEYLSSMGFDKDGVMADDKDILAFFYMDFSDLKKYVEVFLSDSIQNKKLSGFAPSTIKIQYNNKLMEAFLEDSKYTNEELEAILRSIKRKKNYVLLSDNRIIDLSKKEATDFYETITDLKLDPKHLNDVREISVIDSLKALAHENNCKIDDYIRKMIDDIANFKKAKYKEPKLNGELRSYQVEGFKWLKTLSDYHIGGILADDMGLGKTIEIITLIKASNVKKPSLIVCPKSLIFNWLNEIARFAPDLKAKEIYGLKSERKEIIEHINPKEKVIYITAYDSLRNDIDDYKVSFEYLVIDEAQYIKNVNAQKTLTVKKIKADHYFALTGTPIENNIIDLWSIFDFMLPGYLEDLNTYKSKYSDEDLQEVLAKRVSPFILRRTKQNVLKDLPSKYERIVTAEMSDKQRKIYDAVKLDAKSKLEQGGKAFDVLPYLMRLRQICVDPATYVENYHGGSGKMDQLMEIVEEYLNNGHRLLIFSQFVKALNLVEEELKKKKIPYFMITGDTEGKKRLEIANAFNNGSKEAVCLVSLKAGGTGLNLIGADTVIHLDPWWNVAAENQASDRSHRIGQTKNVEVIKLICANSIEQRVIELQNIKKDLIDKLISNDDSSVTKATIEDIKFMLD